jgi:hypothetical protein
MSLIDFTGFEDGGQWPATGVGTFTDFGGYLTIPGGGSRSGSFWIYNGPTNASLASHVNVDYPKRLLTALEEHDTIIYGVAVKREANNAASLVVFASDAGATGHIFISSTSTGAIEVRRGSHTGTLLGSVAAIDGVTSQNTWYYFEFKVKLHDTTGTVEIKRDNVTVLSLTGQDTKNAGTKTVFDCIYTTLGTVATSGVRWGMDDVYILNGDATAPNNYLGCPRVQPLTPNADGTYSDYDGSDGNSINNYLLVDERPHSSSDYNESDIAGEKDFYNLSNITFAANDVVQGVKMHVSVFNTDASTRDIKLDVRSGGTNHAGPAVSIGTGPVQQLKRLMAKNPVTTVLWTQAEVNALEAGTEIV